MSFAGLTPERQELARRLGADALQNRDAFVAAQGVPADSPPAPQQQAPVPPAPAPQYAAPQPDPLNAPPPPQQQPQQQPPRDLSDGTDTSKAIPYDRFAQVNEERKTLQSQMAESDRVVSELRAQLEEMKRATALDTVLGSEDQPTGFEEWGEDKRAAYRAQQLAQQEARSALPEQTLQDMQAMLFERNVEKSINEALSRDQLAKCIEIARTAPGLPGAQLVVLARHQAPELFGGPSTQQGPSHHVQDPTGRAGPPGTVPGQPDPNSREAQIAQIHRLMQSGRLTSAEGERAGKELMRLTHFS